MLEKILKRRKKVTAELKVVPLKVGAERGVSIPKKKKLVRVDERVDSLYLGGVYIEEPIEPGVVYEVPENIANYLKERFGKHVVLN